MKNPLLTVLIILITILNGFSQSLINQVMPPEPNSANLGRFGQLPVGKFTGTVNVDIPIHELRAGDITVPISFSYHTSGIRVEDIASSYGLGVVLQAGGMITRQVNGGPDSYLDQKKPPYIANQADFSALIGNSANQPDSQHDIYYYNFGAGIPEDL